MSPITKTLIFINAAIFALQSLHGDTWVATFALWPVGSFPVSDQITVGFQLWQLVTSAFLHASLLHLGLNMWALYMFGHEVERTLGSRHYLILYCAAVLTAACVQLIVVSLARDAGVYPTVGASGGVFGILLAFGLLFPRRIIVLLIPPVPMQARFFVILYGLIELVSGVLGTQAGIAHFAHLGGMLGGYIVLRYWSSKRAGLN